MACARPGKPAGHAGRQQLKNDQLKTMYVPTFFDYLAIFIHPNQVQVTEEDCNTSESSMLSSAATNDADCGSSVHTFSALRRHRLCARPPPPQIPFPKTNQPQTNHLTPHPSIHTTTHAYFFQNCMLLDMLYSCNLASAINTNGRLSHRENAQPSYL